MNATRRWGIGRILAHVFLVVAAALTVYPILQIVTISLRPTDQLYSTSLAVIPPHATLRAYVVMVTERAFLLTQMFPATMLMLPLYVMLKALGLLDTFAGLALAYTATALPFCVMTMRGYYDTIPVDLEQAALIDGCSPWQAFLRVSLPLAAPALAITALFSFMAAWSEFLVARIVITSLDRYTLPLGLESLAGQFQTEWANYAAGSLMVCVPVMVLFVALNRYLVSGLSLGGVKG